MAAPVLCRGTKTQQHMYASSESFHTCGLEGAYGQTLTDRKTDIDEERYAQILTWRNRNVYTH